MLELKINTFKDENKSLNVNYLHSLLPSLKKTEGFICLKGIYSQSIQAVIKRLDLTYQAFFRKCKNGEGKGFPHFRSCKYFFNIQYPQGGYKYNKNSFTTKRYGTIPYVLHREVQGNIKLVQIHCNETGTFYLLITTDHEFDKEYSTTNKVVGIDVGIANIIVTSTGEVVKTPYYSKWCDKVINAIRSYRDLHYKCGSRNYIRLSKKIKRLYVMKKNRVSDFLHKATKWLSSIADTIICEDLRIKKMSESNKTGLNRELRNSCIAQLFQYLKYKAKCIIFVPPFNTSKTCNKCGRIYDMPLHIRTMKCECGNVSDRDINAARNILCLGQAYLEKGKFVKLSALFEGAN